MKQRSLKECRYFIRYTAIVAVAVVAGVTVGVIIVAYIVFFLLCLLSLLLLVVAAILSYLVSSCVRVVSNIRQRAFMTEQRTCNRSHLRIVFRKNRMFAPTEQFPKSHCGVELDASHLAGVDEFAPWTELIPIGSAGRPPVVQPANNQPTNQTRSFIVTNITKRLCKPNGLTNDCCLLLVII